MYTVGPDYAHAEARKSPALDGKVERDKNGKEVRYPVILTAREKFIARKISLVFKVFGLFLSIKIVLLFMECKGMLFIIVIKHCSVSWAHNQLWARKHNWAENHS